MRFFRGLFVAVWLAVQAGLPLVMKFGFPPVHYRYARFSWAMYGRPPLFYEVRLFRGSAEGPPQRLQELYLSPQQVEERYAGLVRHIAQTRADGAVYGVSLRWIRSFEPDLPERREFQCESR